MVDRVVQVEGVHVADVQVELALELRSERGPVALHDVAQVVVLAPVRRDALVDRARQLVENRRWVAVGALGRVDRLPDVVLPRRTALAAEGPLDPVPVADLRVVIRDVIWGSSVHMDTAVVNSC